MEPNFRRLLDTLRLIPADRKISTPEILGRLKALGYNVTPRTLQRDLETLEREFGLVPDRRSKPYGWRWSVRARPIHLPEMGWPEALSFYLLHQYLENLLPASVQEHLAPYMKEAERKLLQQFPHVPLSRWPDKVRVSPPGQPMRSPKVLRTVRDTVMEALLMERQLDIRYRRAGSTILQNWRIHPLGLVQHGRIFYLAVRIADYDDVRMLALHRIEHVAMLDAAIQSPMKFSLDRWLREGAMGFGGEGSLRLIAVFHDGSGRHLLESPLSEDQKVIPVNADGSVLKLTATVRDTEQLRWWLLGFGGSVEVIAPKALRSDIASRLRAGIRRYSKGAA